MGITHLGKWICLPENHLWSTYPSMDYWLLLDFIKSVPWLSKSRRWPIHCCEYGWREKKKKKENKRSERRKDIQAHSLQPNLVLMSGHIISASQELDQMGGCFVLQLMNCGLASLGGSLRSSTCKFRNNSTLFKTSGGCWCLPLIRGWILINIVLMLFPIAGKFLSHAVGMNIDK